jgi:putative hydrolase of the HAD superfamily
MRARPAQLLFDLDDVLVAYDHGVRSAALAAAIGGGVDPQVVREVLFGADGLEFGCDRGEYDLDEYLARLHLRCGWSLDAASFVAARAAATHPVPAMLALCDALAPQARLAIFSNNGAWVEAHAKTIVPGIASRFGGDIVCSGSLRASKPAPAAFAACLARLGATPEATLFVDDKAVNAEGARLAGLDSLQFTNLPTLRRDLRARGFDLPGDDRLGHQLAS